MDEFDQYKPPEGMLCAHCEHVAKGIWALYTQKNGAQRFEWRCLCCTALGKLERAKWYASQVSKLETEYEATKANCEVEQK